MGIIKTVEGKTDEELVLEIQEGNILSFETLVRRYQVRIIYFARRYVRNQDLAEEVAQDCFLKVYRAIDRVDPNRKFSTFLFEVAKNQAISRLRQKPPEVPLSETVAAEAGPDVVDKVAVHQAVQKLPKTYRRAVELYYFSDLSYEEIGYKLHLPINTVRTHLRRAKEKLKWMLQNK